MKLAELLQTVISQFTAEILRIIQAAPLSELLETAETPAARGKPAAKKLETKAPSARPARATKGRLKRRSLEEIRKTVADVAMFLRHQSGGARAEQIKNGLRLDAREMPRVLRQGIGDKQFKILSGQKRATVYGIGGAKKTPSAPAKAKVKSAKSTSTSARKSPKKAKKASAAG